MSQANINVALLTKNELLLQCNKIKNHRGWQLQESVYSNFGGLPLSSNSSIYYQNSVHYQSTSFYYVQTFTVQRELFHQYRRCFLLVSY